MSYSHDWSDEWPYFSEVEQAAAYIGAFCRRWGRFGGQTKEKYGTVRFYVNFHYQLHDLVYPGYCYIQWRSWWRKLDSIYMRHTFDWCRRAIHWWQRKVYKWAYRRAAKRWPMIWNEIYYMADCQELLPEFPYRAFWKSE